MRDRKYLYYMLLGSFIALNSCGNSAENAKPSTPVVLNTKPIDVEPEGNSKDNTTVTFEPAVNKKDDQIYAPGLEKLKKSDCSSCHLVDGKMVGPSFKEIAAAYESTPENITKLAKTVISGSKGVWGDFEMIAHPGLTQRDAEDMVKYILSVK